jgi:hypothetical protein
MPSLKFNCDQVTAYQFRQAALREGRSVAEYVKRCALTGMVASPPITMPDAEVVREERNMDGKTTVAAYLSGKLASAIKQIARETGRSQSHVMRDLIRTELRNRGLLPSPGAVTGTEPTPVNTTTDAA